MFCLIKTTVKVFVSLKSVLIVESADAIYTRLLLKFNDEVMIYLWCHYSYVDSNHTLLLISNYINQDVFICGTKYEACL